MKHIFKTSVASFMASAFTLLPAMSEARIPAGPWCSPHIATTTSYFIPHVKDYCASGRWCPAFQKEVNMQGSGIEYGGKIRRYTGKRNHHIAGRVEDSKGCDTARGAAGVCLIPFVSVAADTRYHRMGDIISMPALKGRKIDLGDGKTFTHPGYLIVHDKGGAIKGPNRFDTFSGTVHPKRAHNVFGYKGWRDLQMASKTQCTSLKRFSVLRRNNGGDAYRMALASIENVKSGTSERTMLASSRDGRGML